MRTQFLNNQYGEAWFRGFGLMMKGIEKYGIRVPFTPAGRARAQWVAEAAPTDTYVVDAVPEPTATLMET